MVCRFSLGVVPLVVAQPTKMEVITKQNNIRIILFIGINLYLYDRGFNIHPVERNENIEQLVNRSFCQLNRMVRQFAAFSHLMN